MRTSPQSVDCMDIKGQQIQELRGVALRAIGTNTDLAVLPADRAKAMEALDAMATTRSPHF